MDSTVSGMASLQRREPVGRCGIHRGLGGAVGPSFVAGGGAGVVGPTTVKDKKRIRKQGEWWRTTGGGGSPVNVGAS